MKDIRLIAVFSLIFMLIVHGCGGGGGAGRYILPGEIPQPPTGGGGGSGSGGSGGQTEIDPDALLASAWEDFRYGAYSSALSKFNQVLTLPQITVNHRAEAYNGIGWSQAKMNGIIAGYNAFTQAASTHNEAKIGLAAALIQKGQQADIANAITQLESIGLSNTSYRFQAVHPIGITNAEAHAMLALCYFLRNAPGDHDRARAQITVARAEDPSSDSSVGQIYKALKDMGLEGI